MCQSREYPPSAGGESASLAEGNAWAGHYLKILRTDRSSNIFRIIKAGGLAESRSNIVQRVPIPGTLCLQAFVAPFITLLWRTQAIMKLNSTNRPCKCIVLLRKGANVFGSRSPEAHGFQRNRMQLANWGRRQNRLAEYSRLCSSDLLNQGVAVKGLPTLGEGSREGGLQSMILRLDQLSSPIPRVSLNHIFFHIF